MYVFDVNSALPAFPLQSICAILAVTDPIAIQMDVAAGRIHDFNYKGKGCRFYSRYSIGTIQQFYSNPKTDVPLVNLAETALGVNKHTASLEITL